MKTKRQLLEDKLRPIVKKILLKESITTYANFDYDYTNWDNINNFLDEDEFSCNYSDKLVTLFQKTVDVTLKRYNATTKDKLTEVEVGEIFLAILSGQEG